MNKVILIGNLTRDPELKTTPNGISVCSFTVAVTRRYKAADGQQQADFINCVAWRQTGEFVSRYFTKGKKLALEGTLQSRTYDAQDGTKRYVTEVQVDNVEFVESRQSSVDGGGSSGGYDRPQDNRNTDAPAQGFDDDFVQVDEDELPF